MRRFFTRTARRFSTSAFMEATTRSRCSWDRNGKNSVRMDEDTLHFRQVSELPLKGIHKGIELVSETTEVLI